MGTRHRAAIGVTEETDCLAIVVSEETGRVSLAAFSEIQIGVTTEELSERLSLHLTGKQKATRRQPLPQPVVERQEEAQADARD